MSAKKNTDKNTNRTIGEISYNTTTSTSLRWFQQDPHIMNITNISIYTINKCFPLGTFSNSNKLRPLVEKKFNTKLFGH